MANKQRILAAWTERWELVPHLRPGSQTKYAMKNTGISKRGTVEGSLAAIMLVILALVCLASLGAETAPVAYFKSFAAAPPSTLVIRFVCTEQHLTLPRDIAITNNGMWSVLRRTSTNYEEFIKDGSAFVAAMSKVPLEKRFQPHADFSAACLSAETAWDLNAAGQITYDMDRVGSRAKQAGLKTTERPLGPVWGNVHVEYLLALGIDVAPGSIVWEGNSFSGLEATHGAEYPPRKVIGNLVVSNDLPILVSYSLGTDLWVTARYSYAGARQIPFPSRIATERFITARDGTRQLIGGKTFDVAEARESLTEEDRRHFDPKYFTETSFDYSTVAAAAFSVLQATSLPRIALPLKHPPGNDPLSQYIRSQLSSATLNLLSAYKGAATNQLLERSLEEDLQRIVRAGPLYTPGRFTTVHLSTNATQTLALDPRGPQLVQLNQMLLIDACRNRAGTLPMEFMEKDGRPVALRGFDGKWHYFKKHYNPTASLATFRVLLFVLVLLPLVVWLARFVLKRRKRGPG